MTVSTDDPVNKGGAPEGNQNSKAGSLIRGAIRRALAENEAKGRDSLNKIVAKMIDQAEEGDKDSRRELFDRLDGKPKQSTELSGPDGGPVAFSEIVIRGVDP